MSWYIDSSAILKLIFTEKETPALDKVMNNKMVTSTLTRVEVKRAVNRINSTKSKVANDVLAQLQYTELDSQTLNLVEAFSPDVTLRTLDAIHVASVLRISEAVQGIITYDKQMIANAEKMGIKVLSPGLKR
ncbi:PIN_MT3492-like domain containing protein [Candidatus Nanopelagicaceae bacterium]